MTPAELDAKSKEWAGRVESVLSEMAAVANSKGMNIYFHHAAVSEQFAECLAEFRHKYETTL